MIVYCRLLISTKAAHSQGLISSGSLLVLLEANSLLNRQNILFPPIVGMQPTLTMPLRIRQEESNTVEDVQITNHPSHDLHMHSSCHNTPAKSECDTMCVWGGGWGRVVLLLEETSPADHAPEASHWQKSHEHSPY